MIQALFAALFWGATDALAGLSSRRANPVLAALWLHLASLILLAPVISLTGMWRSLTWHDAALGMGAGVAAAVGDVLFGHSLSRSSMSVGIPLANVVAAAVPVCVALTMGEHLTIIGVLGIVGAFVATGLSALPSNGRLAVAGSMTAVATGLCFGVMYGFLTGVHGVNSLVVVFVMRAAGTVALLAKTGGKMPGMEELTGAGAVAGLASGVASVVANLLFIHAVTTGPKAAVSVWHEMPWPFEGAKAILLPRSEKRSMRVAAELRRAGVLDFGEHLAALAAQRLAGDAPAKPDTRADVDEALTT